MTSDPHFAGLRTAYAGVDDLGQFTSEAAVERYRSMLISRSEPQASLIASRLAARVPVVEVACGNGRVLMALSRNGSIAQSLGVDIARSRIAFASKWAEQLGLSGVRFVCGNVLDVELEAGHYGAALCLTGALGYFEPVAAGSALRLLRQLRTALRPGGLLCLEIYTHKKDLEMLARAGGKVRSWAELDAEDPWRFYLSELEQGPSGQDLIHRKVFIKRHSGEVDGGRLEVLHLYDRASLGYLLEDAGFSSVEFLDGWSERAESSDTLVVFAHARG